MVKYNFSFTEDEIEIIFMCLVMIGQYNLAFSDEIGEIIEKHELLEICNNIEDSYGR